MPPLVIAVGNSTRSDDGVGPQIAEVLEVVAPSACYRIVHQLTPDLVEDIAEARLVLFIDASVAATELTITPIEPSGTVGGSHETTPGGLLQLAEQIYQCRPERALQVAIPATDFRFGERLSDETARWAQRAVASIAALLLGEECLLGQD